MSTDDKRSDIQKTKDWLKTARTLSEALPYLQRYDKKTIVIKYGGHAMGDAEKSDAFARDVVLLNQCGIDPVVVHGGGPQIASMLSRLDIPSQFVQGLRVTDAATMEVVQMVLAGSINKEIVSALNAVGGMAVGLCGKDANLLKVTPVQKTIKDLDTGLETNIDFGFVGDPSDVNPSILTIFQGSDIIPVISPIGMDEKGQSYNVNADTVAGAIAGAIHAERLLLLTDVAGVKGEDGEVIHCMTVSQAQHLIDTGVATGGMIPKLETCIDAISRGVKGVVILDGRVPHAVLLELFTELGAGTLIVPDKAE